MQAQQLNLNVISNNIANVNTTGYKKNKIEFQDLLYQNPRQSGGQTGAGNVIPTGVEMGNGTKAFHDFVDLLFVTFLHHNHRIVHFLSIFR